MINIIIAFIAGAMVILSMTINSSLSRKIGVFQGAFVNYAVGLFFAIIAFAVTRSYNTIAISKFQGLPFWAYLGGAVGVVVVGISNVIIPKIPTIYSTLLIFIGQLFAGILIDFFREGLISKGKIIGGILIIAGMMYNFCVDNSENKNKNIELNANV